MYKNVFTELVKAQQYRISLGYISEAIQMYDVCVPLLESLEDYHAYIQDMLDISS